jgi:hypothetical protein
MIETKLHPADDLFAWMVYQVSSMNPRNVGKTSFVEIKQKLHELYLRGYEDGQENEHGENRRSLGK